MFVAFCIFDIFCNNVVMVVNTFAWITFQHVACIKWNGGF